VASRVLGIYLDAGQRTETRRAHTPEESRVLVVAVLSLALGIGVNTTLYGVFRSVFLQAPTAAEPARLVRIEPGNGNRISYANFRDLQHGREFEGLAAYSITRLNLQRGEANEPVAAMIISSGFFDLLGAQPALGRRPSADEKASAIITQSLWQTKFSADPSTLGSSIKLNGRSYSVIGILPASFRSVNGVLAPEIYVPISPALAPSMNQRGSGISFTVIGRLRSGVSSKQAAAAVTSQAQVLEQLYRHDNQGFGRPAILYPVSGLGSWMSPGNPMGQMLTLSVIPFVLFGTVLLIACANVAGLLLARSAARRRELAIRLALGATRRQIVGTLLAESAWLALLGSAAGLLLAIWLCEIVTAIPLPQTARLGAITPDFTVLLYALGLGFVTVLLCGLSPALTASNVDLGSALKKEPVPSGRRLSSRNVLVVAQAALSVVLLFISVLFLRSVDYITTVDPGFDIDHTLTAHVDLDRTHTPERNLQTAEQALRAAATVSGVQAVTLANMIPLGGDAYFTRFNIRGSGVTGPRSPYMSAGPNYFRTMGIPIRAGRDSSFSDRANTPPVVIVNETFVRAYQLSNKAVGAQVRSGDGPWAEVVGVAGDTNHTQHGEIPQPILYRPFLQTGGDTFVIARTVGPPGARLSEFARVINNVDPTAIRGTKSHARCDKR
jgi:putative ABC transport system permease protein